VERWVAAKDTGVWEDPHLRTFHRTPQCVFHGQLAALFPGRCPPHSEPRAEGSEDLLKGGEGGRR